MLTDRGLYGREQLMEGIDGVMNGEEKMRTQSRKSRSVAKIGRRLLAAALLLIGSKPTIAQDVERHVQPVPGQLSETAAPKDMAGANVASLPTDDRESLPDASQPSTSSPSQNAPTSWWSGPAPARGGSGSGVNAFLLPTLSRKRLTAEDKFQIYTRQMFGPENFLVPAWGAGFYMLNPPSRCAREWKDGGGAFGKWYGEQMAAGTSRRTGQFLAAVAWHEDPRYVPSGSKNVLARTFHAVAFTFVDRTDSGHKTFAFSNFAGAAAGGFARMGLLPDGLNDVTHAEQRALRGLAMAAIRNLAMEYRPEWERLLHKTRIPRTLPKLLNPKYSARL